MPSAAPRICKCGAKVPAGQRCRSCEKAHDASRGSASQRGYDREWQRLRERYLSVHQYCHAEGCGSRSKEIDHVVPISVDPSKRLVWNNLRAFCKHHHSQRTMRDQHAARREARGGRRG